MMIVRFHLPLTVGTQDNILVNKDGQPMLSDFGTSRLLQYTQAALRTTVGRESNKGTARWMAYELLCLPASSSQEDEENSSDEETSEYEEDLPRHDSVGGSTSRQANISAGYSGDTENLASIENDEDFADESNLGKHT